MPVATSTDSSTVTITVEATDLNSNVVTRTFVVTSLPAYGDVDANGTVNSTDASIYEWDFGDGATSAEFSPYNFYETTGWHPVTLIANNEFNCPDTFLVEQAVKGNVETRINLPNAFTPNESGPNGGYWTVDDMFNNDIFFPLYKGVEEFEMQIFNKWGELLFESTDVRRGWDGYYHGNLCQQDVYVWRVKVTFQDGGDLVDSGDVTLIR
jgi:gliding motility-associated-like protein